METKEHFKKALKIYREEVPFTQTELAAVTNLKPSAISHFECGRRTPTGNLYPTPQKGETQDD